MLLLGFKLSCGKIVKYRYIAFFVSDYDSLPISFQTGISFPLVALDEIKPFSLESTWKSFVTDIRIVKQNNFINIIFLRGV